MNYPPLAPSPLYLYNIPMLSYRPVFPQHQSPLPKTQSLISGQLPSVSLLQRCGVDARSLAEIKRRHVPKYTSMYILGLRVCNANSLLHRTTAVHGGIDTLSIFSSGTDAARIMQKRCFGTAETRCQKCTRMYAFGNATTQMPAYLQKGLDMIVSNSIILTAYSLQLISAQRKGVGVFFSPVNTKRQDLTKEILFAMYSFSVILRSWKSENNQQIGIIKILFL